jgi:hypothetical protein
MNDFTAAPMPTAIAPPITTEAVPILLIDSCWRFCCASRSAKYLFCAELDWL